MDANQRLLDASQLLIVIPARGGSKGLPGKNAKKLGRYPLLQWTYDAVKLAGLTDAHCILSTDDNTIADIGKEIGLPVPFIRPNELATDTATAVDVVKHAIDWFEKEQHVQAKYVMLLQPTSPFRPPQIIREAFRLINDATTNTTNNNKKIDAVIGTKPIHRALGTLFYADQNNALSALKPQTELITRRQDTRTLFTPNGAMYIITCEVLKAQNTLFPEHTYGIQMDQIQSHDIDDPKDWAIANSYVDADLSWRSDNPGSMH